MSYTDKTSWAYSAIKPKKIDKVSNELLSFIKGATLIIHNAPFDLGFLNNELKRLNIKLLIFPYEINTNLGVRY